MLVYQRVWLIGKSSYFKPTCSTEKSQSSSLSTIPIILYEANDAKIQTAEIRDFILWTHLNMGLSENSVPLHPMVNDHYPY